MGEIFEVILFILLVAIGAFLAFVLYFLPTLVAYKREHHNTKAIGILNLFLGWIVLGWIGALVWSMTSNKKSD